MLSAQSMADSWSWWFIKLNTHDHKLFERIRLSAVRMRRMKKILLIIFFLPSFS